MDWPKTITVRGVQIVVNSWEEVREAIAELGNEVLSIEAGRSKETAPKAPQSGGLNHNDRTLMIQFVEAGDRGLLTSQIAQAVGKKGKGVRPALERWSRRIELVTEDGASAFEAIKRFDGRGFKMVEHFRRAAQSMLGKN